MAGVTDLPFRVICRENGADYTVSEMVSAKWPFYIRIKRPLPCSLSIPRSIRRRFSFLVPLPARQLAAAGKIVESRGADMIDVNMGCPVHKIVSNGEGSALMKDPDKVYAILAALVDAVSIPVTVKFRAGWDEAHKNAAVIAQMAEKAGVSAVCVHGRTRAQFYQGKADWDIIRAVKESVGIPVLGNGDIFHAEDALRMKEETGCDGVMIARGAEGNPWIFRDVKALLHGKAISPVFRSGTLCHDSPPPPRPHSF